SFPHPSPLVSADWSRDGRWLAAGCNDRRIYVYDVKQHRLHSVLEGHQASVLGVAFCPVGELLASASWDNTLRLWDPMSGKQWVSTEADGNASPHFSPDGQRLGFKKDSTFNVWELASGQVCRTWHDGAMGNRAPWVYVPGSFGPGSFWADFIPDGRLLALAT